MRDDTVLNYLNTWIGSHNRGSFCENYFNNIFSLRYINSTSLNIDLKYLYETLLMLIADLSLSYIIDIQNYNIDDVNASNVPQFSTFKFCVSDVLSTLLCAGNHGINYTDMGRYLLSSGKTETAYKKYGENHSKTSELLDLVYIRREGCSQIFLSQFGKVFLEQDVGIIQQIIRRLILRIPLIRNICQVACKRKTSVTEHINFLSKSTQSRRFTNIKYLFSLLFQENDPDINRVFMNIEME